MQQINFKFYFVSPPQVHLLDTMKIQTFSGFRRITNPWSSSGLELGLIPAPRPGPDTT